MKQLKGKKSYVLLAVLTLLTLIQYILFRLSTGTLLLILLTFITAIHIALKELKKRYPGKITRIISATYRAGLLIIGLLSILILILVARPLKECQELDVQEAEKVSHMIVLGAGLKRDQVSERLKLRLDKALEALEANNQIIAIVSGGQGSDELISEAEAMRRYLVEAGLPEESILKENRSRSTYENLLYSKEILDTLETPKEIMIVTSDFHIFRSRFIAKKLGWEVQTLCSKSEPHVLSNYMIREIPAVINDFIRLKF